MDNLHAFNVDGMPRLVTPADAGQASFPKVAPFVQCEELAAAARALRVQDRLRRTGKKTLERLIEHIEVL